MWSYQTIKLASRSAACVKGSQPLDSKFSKRAWSRAWAEHSVFSVDREDNNDDDRDVGTDPAAGCVINHDSTVQHSEPTLLEQAQVTERDESSCSTAPPTSGRMTLALCWLMSWCVFTVRVHENVAHPSNNALVLLSPVYIHLTAQLCTVFTCLLVPSGGRAAAIAYSCRRPKLLWLNGSTRGHCRDLYYTSPWCSTVVPSWCHANVKKNLQQSVPTSYCGCGFLCFLLNVSTVFTLHRMMLLRLFKIRFWPMGPLSKDWRQFFFFPQTLKWSSTVTKMFHVQLPSLEMEMIS